MSAPPIPVKGSGGAALSQELRNRVEKAATKLGFDFVERLARLCLHEDPHVALKASGQLLPYLYPKLSSVTITDSEGNAAPRFTLVVQRPGEQATVVDALEPVIQGELVEDEDDLLS